MNTLHNISNRKKKKTHEWATLAKKGKETTTRRCIRKKNQEHLFVTEFDGVGEEHGADVAGVGSGHGDDVGLGQFVKDPGLFLQPEGMGRRYRDCRLGMHLDVPDPAFERELIGGHPWIKQSPRLGGDQGGILLRRGDDRAGFRRVFVFASLPPLFGY